MPEPRLDLIAHIKEQIKADPEAYANPAKLAAALSSPKLVEDINDTKETD